MSFEGDDRWFADSWLVRIRPFGPDEEDELDVGDLEGEAASERGDSPGEALPSPEVTVASERWHDDQRRCGGEGPADRLEGGWRALRESTDHERIGWGSSRSRSAGSAGLDPGRFEIHEERRLNWTGGYPEEPWLTIASRLAERDE